MRLLATALLALTPAEAQILVSMDLMSTKGSSPQVGKGTGAYVWNLHIVPAGTDPVPFTLIRMNFPEVRLYSLEQQNDILKYRVDRSPAKRLLKWAGYAAAGSGLAIQVNNTMNKSSSQLGTAITLGGLAVPLIQALASSAIPNYAIPDPCPAIVQVPMGSFLECTALANFGHAPESIHPRRIDAIKSDPLIRKD